MFWIFLSQRTISLVDQAMSWFFRWMITVCFSISLCHYFGWIERWIWWKLEDEASKALNHANVTIGSFRLIFDEILQGKLTVCASNIIIHTKNREEWKWESPLVARIGKARVECNAPITIFHLVLFKQHLPIELYTLMLADVQVFIERYESVFNVYLMDPCCVLPPAPFEPGNENQKAEVATSDEDMSIEETVTPSSSSSKGDDRHHEEAQKLVDGMLGSVETLGRAARKGTFSRTVRQQGLELADRIREGLGKENRSNAEKKQQLVEGVSVLRTAGKVAVKSLQSTPQLILPERLNSGSKKPPLCRVARIVLKDLRIFTRNNWIQLQDEDSAGNTAGASNNKVGWNRPIFIAHMVVRAAEMCPPMSLKDGDELPAVYQTIDKVIEIVWRRLLTEIAKSNTGKLFSTALFEVLDLMKTSASINNTPTGTSIDSNSKG